MAWKAPWTPGLRQEPCISHPVTEKNPNLPLCIASTLKKGRCADCVSAGRLPGGKKITKETPRRVVMEEPPPDGQLFAMEPVVAAPDPIASTRTGNRRW